MKNIITIVVGFIATLAIIGIIGQYFQAEYEAMEDRVAALEQQRDELQSEVNSVTDAIQVENASLTDAYEKVTILQNTVNQEETTTEEQTTEKVIEETTTEETETDSELDAMVFATQQDENLGGIVKDKDKYEVYVEEESPEEETSNYEYLGVYDLTAYAWTGNPCANGNYPSCSYTVACNSLPLGTRIYIEGYGEYVVEDRGASWHSSNWIDVYMGDYSSCIQFGTRSANVYLVK